MIQDTLKQIKTALILLLLFSILTGILYPLFITGVAQLLFPWQANGSLITYNKKVMGSQLIGQLFTDPKYFLSRPSATAPFSYNPTNSTGSNLGPLNQGFLANLKTRVASIKQFDPENNKLVPVDLVTSSGSGLDPQISPYAAFYQIHRIASLRGLSENELRILVINHIEHRTFGLLGEPRVNVVQLNIALDNLMLLRKPQ